MLTFKKLLVTVLGMEAKEIMEQLAKTDEFNGWKAQNEKDILAHVFCEKDNSQVGYYNHEKQTMTTFILTDPVQVIPDQEVLRGDSDIASLDVDTITITAEQAKEIAQKTLEEEYGKPDTMKELIILQNLEGKNMYNITYFTRSLRTVNVKVSAEDGVVVHHSKASLVSRT